MSITHTINKAKDRLTDLREDVESFIDGSASLSRLGLNSPAVRAYPNVCVQQSFSTRLVLQTDINAAVEKMFKTVLGDTVFVQEPLPNQLFRNGARETQKQARRRHYLDVTLAQIVLEEDEDEIERQEMIEEEVFGIVRPCVELHAYQIVASERHVLLRVQFRQKNTSDSDDSGFDESTDDETADIRLLVSDNQLPDEQGNNPVFNSLPNIGFAVPQEYCDDPTMGLNSYIYAALHEQLGVVRQRIPSEDAHAYNSCELPRTTGVIKGQSGRPCSIDSVRSLCEVGVMGFTGSLRGVVSDEQRQIINVPLIVPRIDEESVKVRLQQGGDRVIRLHFAFPLASQRRPTDADAVKNAETGELELTSETMQMKFQDKLSIGLNAPYDKWLQIQRPLELGFELILRFRENSEHMYIREWHVLTSALDAGHRSILDGVLQDGFKHLRRQHPMLFSRH